MEGLYLIKIYPGATDGFTWPQWEKVAPGERNFFIVGGNKFNLHLVEEGKNMVDRVSVSRKKLKIIRRIK